MIAENQFAAARAQLISKPPETVIYETVYGSWAHGTNTPLSDVDWRGCPRRPAPSSTTGCSRRGG